MLVIHGRRKHTREMDANGSDLRSEALSCGTSLEASSNLLSQRQQRDDLSHKAQVDLVPPVGLRDHRHPPQLRTNLILGDVPAARTNVRAQHPRRGHGGIQRHARQAYARRTIGSRWRLDRHQSAALLHAGRLIGRVVTGEMQIVDGHVDLRHRQACDALDPLDHVLSNGL